jgi:hypothetical protein
MLIQYLSNVGKKSNYKIFHIGLALNLNDIMVGMDSKMDLHGLGEKHVLGLKSCSFSPTSHSFSNHDNVWSVHFNPWSIDG